MIYDLKHPKRGKRAKCEKILAKCDKIPIKCDKIPIKCDKIPAKCDKINQKCAELCQNVTEKRKLLENWSNLIEVSKKGCVF